MKTIQQSIGGETIDLLRPRQTPIRIDTIAKALSQINRFGGHTLRPFSVLRHSVHVAGLAWHLAKERGIEGDLRLLVRAAVLHDAHEAYVGDVTSPVKAALRELAQANGRGSAFDFLEQCWEERVREVLLPEYQPDGAHAWIEALVKEADATSLLLEYEAFGPAADFLDPEVESALSLDMHAYFVQLYRASALDRDAQYFAEFKRMAKEGVL